MKTHPPSVSLLIPFVCLLGALTACKSTANNAVTGVVAVEWPEAEAPFHDAERWHGADSAYSVDLGEGRILWLFGDSFVGLVDEPHTRSNSRMVRNTLAIQQGANPSDATFEFYYDDTDADDPRAFFDDGDADDVTFLWPGPGHRFATGALLLTFMRLESSDQGLGFLTVGSMAMLIDNPDEEPTAWTWSELSIPAHDLGAKLGAGAFYEEGEWLYAFAPVEPGEHDVYLARWTLERASSGDLSALEWWSGDALGWTADSSAAVLIADDVQTEFSVHRGPDALLWMISVDGFGAANIVARSAERVEGPWSQPKVLIRPEAAQREDGILIYSAKAHPELEGGDIIVTFCSNNLDFWTLAGDMSLYFPHFVRVSVE